MWNAGWGWLKAWRSAARGPARRVARRPDPAEMGVDFGLDAALESCLPLLERTAPGAGVVGTALGPFGSDRRSRLA